MLCIKFKHSKPAGCSGFQPWHSTLLALMKVIADKAGLVPSPKGREGIFFSTSSIWTCDEVEHMIYLVQIHCPGIHVCVQRNTHLTIPSLPPHTLVHHQNGQDSQGFVINHEQIHKSCQWSQALRVTIGLF